MLLLKVNIAHFNPLYIKRLAGHIVKIATFSTMCMLNAFALYYRN
jgi:hypothetical protein